MSLIKLLPSYVGSKAFWVDKLKSLEGLDFVELFAGSSVLSINLAGKAILNDKDPYIYKILSCFDELIVPDVFTLEDYYRLRNEKDWWKNAFCFQKMSFSGVFRYSKNGYNVPSKKIQEIKIRKDYIEALERWEQLKPTVTNVDYKDVPMSCAKNSVVIFDPPYENCQASYNSKFDYHSYWELVRLYEGIAKCVVVFDDFKNIPFENFETRGMAVNGLHKKSKEGMFVFHETLKVGKQGEDLFHKLNPSLKREDGLIFDFKNEKDKTIELKSDYYDMNKTKNFFIERYSYQNKNGSPWQAMLNKVDYFAYFYVKNKICYVFDTVKMVKELDGIIPSLEKIKIGNDGYETIGYKIPRNLLTDSLICVKKYSKEDNL